MTRKATLLLLLPLALAMHVGARAAVPGEHQCLIEPFQKIEIRSTVEALIGAVKVKRGSVVKKGQVLVQLESSVEEAALASARYRAVMEGQMRSSEARLAYSRDKLKRREELSRQNFVSTQERDDAYAEMRVAEAELLAAKDDRQLSVLETRRLQELLRLRTLVSPFNGVVTEVLQHPGELAQTGEGARPILKLAQIHPLRVEVVLPVTLYNRIADNAAAEVETEVPAKARYPAKVQIVDKVIDSASGTFGVRLELPNPGGKIPAGVKCLVRFQ